MSITGSELSQLLRDYFPQYNPSVQAQVDRAMRHATLVTRQIANEVRAIEEDFLMVSATFDTEANRSPNRYPIPQDFGDIRFMEQVRQEANGDYVRVLKLQHIKDKDVPSISHFFPSEFLSSPTSTGSPQGYFFGGDFFFITPISDQAYKMRIWYDCILPDVTEASQVPLPDQTIPSLVEGMAEREAIFRKLPEAVEFNTRYHRKLIVALDSMSGRMSDGANRINYQDDPSEYV